MRHRLPDHKVQGCVGGNVQPNRLSRGYHTPAPCVAAPRALCWRVSAEAMGRNACPLATTFRSFPSQNAAVDSGRSLVARWSTSGLVVPIWLTSFPDEPDLIEPLNAFGGHSAPHYFDSSSRYAPSASRVTLPENSHSNRRKKSGGRQGVRDTGSSSKRVTRASANKVAGF